MDLAQSLRSAAEKAGIDLTVLDNPEEDVVAAMENTDKLVAPARTW